MKTLYKKMIIIGAATLLLEGIIVYFIFVSINAFYNGLTNRIAYLLTEQVKSVIIPENFDFSKISQYNKYPVRRLLNRFSREDSKIISVLLIDKNNRIIISSDPSAEGKEYRSPRELKLLNTDKPEVISRNWRGDIEIIDVIWPLFIHNERQGFLRTVISVRNIQKFYKDRRTILSAASVFTFAIILLTVLLTSKIYQSNLQNINQAIDHLSQDNFEFRPKYSSQDEFTPVFTGLSKLYEKNLDLSESFRQAEEKIQAMMQVIHEGLVVIDMNMKIVSFNDYLLDILEIRKHSAPEDNLYRTLHKNPKLIEMYRRARDPMTHAVKKILTLELLSGKRVDVQVNARSISSNGSGEGAIIIYIKNMGLVQEVEQNLHRSMQYGVISQLASSIGHEIRNPLSSMAIHAEVVGGLVEKSVIDNSRRAKIKKSLHILNSEVERLGKLIDQFFNLAKSKEINLTSEDMNDVLEEVIELVQQQAMERNINIHRFFGANLPRVNISKDQVKQVIINLILNAFDSMPKGGDLYLRSGFKEGTIILSIKDTGKGIPPEITDRVFDLYFSTKENGGGIGLAISRKIIEAHEGKLYFESEMGVGTIFFIELPVS